MRFLSSILLSLFFTLPALAQDNYTISGTIKEMANGEDLIGANITVKELPGTGTITNIYGFYSLTLPAGKYTLVYSSMGFEAKEILIDLQQNIHQNIEIEMKTEMLNEVVVTAEREDQNVSSNEMGVSKIELKEIETIPVLFGERDILKTIQLLPGVTGAGEGQSGFYVRGGSADQNLILLDEAPVYNASHLLGFFSVFNSAALKDVKLYKGFIPAEFGGRLSSVMDVKMKEGNSKELDISGGIGLISSKLTVEAPINKGKGSFIVAGRRTYVDMFLKLSSDEDQRDTRLYFYDLNAKVNYRLGTKDRLFLSGYFGRDNFSFSDLFGFDWGNSTGTARWNHIYNDKLFGNASIIFSKYSYKIRFGADDDGVEIGSDIQDINLKKDFDFFLNSRNTLKFGGNVIYHTFRPGEISTTGSTFINLTIENRYSLESAVYLSNQQKLSDVLSVSYGLRYSNFTQMGPGEIYSYDKNGLLTDSTDYDRFEPVASYNGLAPRISGKYMLNEVSSVKLGYSRTYQYLHLISNTTSSSPTDIWLPSSNNIAPRIADQVGLGYFRNFRSNTYEFSIETYYKEMQREIDYRVGADVTLNATVEGELLYGEGRAYGLELFLKKRKGKLTGWISYTLARTERRFEEIDEGQWFPARQDRTHDVSVVGMYRLNKRIRLSATWVYYTGNAVTFPSGKYGINGQVIDYYTERNGYRMPDYHRLDLGLSLAVKKFKRKRAADGSKIPRKYEASWDFSVYNAYARQNAYIIDFREKEGDPTKTEAIQISLFSIIPSVSYKFKF